MLIGITGFIGSGKDTVAGMLVEQGCVQDSFASPLKDLCASIFGWDRDLLVGDTVDSRDFRETPDLYWTRKLNIDNFTPRLALQLIGTEIMRTHFNQNIWLDSLEYPIRKQANNNNCIVVSDARFKNELDLIKDLGGVVLHVVRDDLPEWYDIVAVLIKVVCLLNIQWKQGSVLYMQVNGNGLAMILIMKLKTLAL